MYVPLVQKYCECNELVLNNGMFTRVYACQENTLSLNYTAVSQQILLGLLYPSKN